ncbi:MAG: hypothetical protein ACREVE_13175 [Gammaproteobacteria bacterium]
MESRKNIDAFNRICVSLFDKLYSAFPIPIDISTASLAESAVPEDASFDEAWEADSIADGAVTFLAEEGFLTHHGGVIGGGEFSQARLTMKGLDILGYVPAALEQKERSESLISRIHGIASDGVKKASSETVRQVVSHIFSMATN